MKPKLHLMMSTGGDLETFEKFGFLERFNRQIRFYRKEFDVEVISSDKVNYSKYLGIKHRTLPFMIQKPIIKQILYFIFIVLSSAKLKRGIIRVFGVSNPALPFVKFLSKNHVVASYHYDWVEQEKIHHNMFKWLVAVLIERFVFISLDYVFTTTKRLEDKLKGSYQIKTKVIPNFVDNSIFYPSVKKKRQIVFVGRLHWLKGLDYFLSAIGKFDKKLRIFIIGSGNEMKGLKELSKDLNLNNIVFTGSLKQKKLSSYLRESYALVLPTITMEGQPKVIIEAFASGTPCIVTDVRGSREIVSNYVNGIVVRPKDVAQLSLAIKKVCEDVDFREMLSRNALKESKKYFIEKIMKEEMKTLNDIIKKN